MNQTAPHTETRSLPGATLRAIVGMGHAVKEHIEGAVGTLDLTWSQYEVLRALAIADVPLMLSELAEHVQCVRSNMTALVDKLERDGLVRRMPNPADRRSIRVNMTDNGLTIYQKAATALGRVEQEVLGVLSADEQLILRNVFARLSR